MLGALLGLLVITFIGWFISIFKKFNRFIKEGSDFTTTQLVCLLISNFVIVSCGVMVIGTIIGSIIEEVNRIHTEQSASLIVVIPLVVGIILSSYGDYRIYGTYLKQKEKINRNSETISCRDGNVVNLSKWRALPFEQKVNYALWIIALLTGIASIVMFFLMFSENVAILWLLLSFISALFVGIWCFLNYQRFTIERCKKYGIIFIVVGFIALISPFIALALLIEGTIMLKKVFGNPNSQESIMPQEETINIDAQEPIDITPQADDQPRMSKIEEVWNFMDFAKIKGQPKRATLTNNDTGENFAALMFPTPQGDKEFTMVAFYSDLGELSVNEIVRRKFELYVVKLESGNYYLCDNKSLQVEYIVNGLEDDKSNDISF